MARAEVYVIDHDQRAHAEWKREGRSPQEARQLLRTRLENQIPAYLGEFILGVRFKEFYYEEKIDPLSGQKYIGAPGFTGDIGKSYEKAIQDAKSRGWSGERETAEGEAFNEKLKPQLLDSPEGTFYIWISPPGPKREGYGDYSFTHIGQIQKTTLGRRYKVISVRNNLELEDHAAILNHFLPEGKKLKEPSAVDFLSNPVLINNEDNHTTHDLLVAVDVILKRERNRVTRFAQAYQERNDWEKDLLKAIDPMVTDYCFLVENGASQEQKQKIIWAMENYTREMINRKSAVINEGPVSVVELNRAIFYQRWGREPEKLAGGSCPPGGSGSSADSFSAKLPFQEHRLGNSHSSEGEKTLECTCPNCKEKVKAEIKNGKIHCPSCGASAEYQC